jgi:hypothetical protein
VARSELLDEYRWRSVESVAPRVERWRYRETLGYVTRIEQYYQTLQGEPSRVNAAKPGQMGKPPNAARPTQPSKAPNSAKPPQK